MIATQALNIAAGTVAGAILAMVLLCWRSGSLEDQLPNTPTGCSARNLPQWQDANGKWTCR